MYLANQSNYWQGSSEYKVCTEAFLLQPYTELCFCHVLLERSMTLFISFNTWVNEDNG